MARWVGLRAKTILTLLGRVSYRRVYFHCKQCHQGEALGDQAWGLEATRTSPALKHLLAYLSATTVGFATVAQNVCRTLHWPAKWLSGKQVQRLAEPVGSRLNDLEEARVASWWAKLVAGSPAEMALAKSPTSTEAASTEASSTGGAEGARRLYIEMDGILARLRGEEGKGSDYWREVKVGLVFLAESGRHASKLAELVGALGARLSVRVWVDRPKGLISYVAGLWPAASFGVRLYAEAIARGLERASEVVILGDGARWIWSLAEEHFPGAIQILDFHHAKAWVWDVAAAVFGQGSQKAREWAEAQIDQHLIRGDASGLVAAIGALPRVAPPEGQSKSVPEQAIEYYQHNASRMRYPEYRAKGLEIGSGIVESAGRRVVGVRCKQPGMRWSEAGLAAIVGLRADVLSNRYDSAIAALPTTA